MRSALLVALFLLGCSGREIPRGVVASDIPPAFSDIVLAPIDRVIPSFDGAPLDDAATLDSAAPADGSASRDAAVDAGPIDVPPPINRMCGFEETQINAVAVKLATCFRVPPQTMMERLWRPETWEGGDVYTGRVCDVFRLCVALAATRGCPAVLATCMKMGVSSAPNDRCDGIVPTCSGVRLRTCAGGVLFEDSCQAGMRECVASAGEGACVQPMTAPCSPGSPPRCEGDTLQRCTTGRWVSVLDCGRTGARCDAQANRCVGADGACTGEGATCDGTVLVRCRGGRLHRQDCGLHVRGSVCRTMGAEAFCGTATDCDPARAPSTGTCEGQSLTLCGGGRTYRFDCAGLGFGSCGSTGCGP